jgi:hypothetical protein
MLILAYYAAVILYMTLPVVFFIAFGGMIILGLLSGEIELDVKAAGSLF